MEKIKKNRILAVLITGLVLPILASLIYDLIKSKTLFTTIWSILKWIFSLIVKVLTFKISLWIILVCILIFIVVIIVIAHFPTKNNEPEFIKYTEDVIRGVTWTWSWELGVDHKWHIQNLKVKCSKCNATMIEYQDYVFACPMCKYDTFGKKFDKPFEIESIIIDRVNNRYNN